jgi:hypothetical protein
MNEMIKYEDVESKIITVRNENVIIDKDIAALYGVETKRVNEAVTRNPDKFPDDYIITLDDDEWDSLRSQIATLETNGKGQHTKHKPTAFTERGLYMLATILKSPVATQTTIAIIDAFANIRELNRIIKQYPNIQDENEQMSLSARAGDVLWEIFDDSMMEISGKETNLKFKLPFLEVSHTVKREKRKEQY